jgi:hypothetical protein
MALEATILKAHEAVQQLKGIIIKLQIINLKLTLKTRYIFLPIGV